MFSVDMVYSAAAGFSVFSAVMEYTMTLMAVVHSVFSRDTVYLVYSPGTGYSVFSVVDRGTMPPLINRGIFRDRLPDSPVQNNNHPGQKIKH